ncbi:DNA repair protein RecN [Cephaloticoccus capnophilus]|uniref:DNA repair protein RecN n=1 Tax=Cephaloticoccus capnophilus TaxID=1548208 RepID=A0A139STP9_9BACT|nr:DNA repair protein RecN [Cephaloticoccus capnophilus]KXU37953.1 DNA repair protein RecN [Cephaloticoccus capnophilus]
MLQSLRIQNLALLEEVELDFEAGFTAVTGETGAGKSILIGALSLLAGQRADKTMIRQGAEALVVEASLFFADSERVDAVLMELELPICEEGVLILRRSLPREKAPKITINGSLATLSALQQLGELWIDFHGPSEPRRLLKESCQLELLDLYGRCGPALETYQRRYRAWREAEAAVERLQAQRRASPEQLEFLQSQLARMEALDLSEEAIGALERDFTRMSQVQELTELAGRLVEGLSGEEGVESRLAAVLADARRLREMDSESATLAERLSSAAIELADVASEASALLEGLQFDPQEAQQVQDNMSAWLDLKRRHGGDLDAVIAARGEMQRQLDEQGDIEGALLRAETARDAALREAQAAAAVLRVQREKAATGLGEVAAGAIAQLGFAKSEFRICIVPKELGPQGDCGVEFLFSPNVGEAALPLNRVASSGELARVMLALKTLLADLDRVPLLVFDEIDANVGGEIGAIVGQKLAQIAQTHQVLCLTHFPQVAAQARRHLLVEKDQTQSRAVVRIRGIEGEREARLGELARMLGDRNAASALAHAQRLLDLA